MRIGVLFLVLQSVLLCSSGQAGTGLLKAYELDYSTSLIAPTHGCDDPKSQNGTDNGDGETQVAGSAAAPDLSASQPPISFLPAIRASIGRAANAIRAPPLVVIHL